MKRYLPLLALFAVAGCHHEVIVPGGSVTTDASGKVTKIQTANGSEEINGNKLTATDNKGNTTEVNGTITEADLGVPFYPGSVEAPGSVKVVEKDKTSVSCNRTTTDTPKQVNDFYVGKLGTAIGSTTTGTLTMSTWEKDNRKILVMSNTQDGKTTIQVTTGPK